MPSAVAGGIDGRAAGNMGNGAPQVKWAPPGGAAQSSQSGRKRGRI